MSFTRFVSIAVLSCMLITGGLWVYNNRSEVDAFRKKGGFHPATWILWWSGVDPEELKNQPLPKEFQFDQKAFKPTFELDPDLMQQFNKPLEFEWDKK